MAMSQPKSVIVVAGGKGLRMGIDLPKQFIPIGGKPVLMHTLQAFYDYDDQINIILVLASSYPDYWATLCEEYNFTIPHKITFGGETRYHSVKNGLKLVTGDVVAVHDAARPFLSAQLIHRCFENIENKKAIIPAIDAVDSLREMTDNTHSRIIDRTKIKLVQTPQVFLTEVLKRAYLQDFDPSFTDDASVVESIGVDVHLVQGETTNIKITNLLDLNIAKLLLEK